MRIPVIMIASSILAACATTQDAESPQVTAEARAAAPPAADQHHANVDTGTVVEGFVFVEGLPPEGQYNAVADESGTILRGVLVDSEGRVCRRERITGSNIPELRCRWPHQWRAMQEAGQDRIRHRQSTGYMFRGG
jgi:hypothetical protein